VTAHDPEKEKERTMDQKQGEPVEQRGLVIEIRVPVALALQPPVKIVAEKIANRRPKD